jgi:hypothetical protein
LRLPPSIGSIFSGVRFEGFGVDTPVNGIDDDWLARFVGSTIVAVNVPFLSFLTRISFSFDELFDALDAGFDTAAVADCALMIDSEFAADREALFADILYLYPRKLHARKRIYVSEHLSASSMGATSSTSSTISTSSLTSPTFCRVCLLQCLRM